MAAPALSPVAALARTGDPDRFLCALFAPAERREALFALIAFNHELARAREAASHPMAALIRLQWWRDAVEEARAGRSPRRHEVATPLHHAIAAGALDPGDLGAMVDAREAETEAAMPTLDALLAHLRGTAGGWAVAAGRLLGAAGPALAALQTLGAAYGMAGVLRSVPALAAQGRSLLPEELLRAEGLTAEAVVHDPRLPGLRPVVARLAAEGEALLAQGRKETARTLPRGAIAAALPAVLARRDLRRLARGDVAEPGPAASRPARSLGDRLAVMAAGFSGRL
jgi:phytoene synthase